MKKQIKPLLCGLCAAALALGCSGSAGSEVPAKVTDIMVWTYYNGDQLESFTSLVDQFNETVGAQKGIRVSTESQGSVNDLETSVMDSAEGKVGDAAGVRYERPCRSGPRDGGPAHCRGPERRRGRGRVFDRRVF